jgi:hypothetical protein
LSLNDKNSHDKEERPGKNERKTGERGEREDGDGDKTIMNRKESDHF